MILNKGTIFIISAPSGAGKTSIIKEILKIRSDFIRSVSYTTRTPRPNEKDSIDYFFITNDEFQSLQTNNEFLESAQVFNNYYATPKKFVFDLIDQGKNVIIECDWQGKQSIENNCNRKIISIFILPPSVETLKTRLIARQTDSEDVINLRLSQAKLDISKADTYNYQIVNDDFAQSVKNINEIIDCCIKENNK